MYSVLLSLLVMTSRLQWQIPDLSNSDDLIPTPLTSVQNLSASIFNVRVNTKYNVCLDVLQWCRLLMLLCRTCDNGMHTVYSLYTCSVHCIVYYTRCRKYGHVLSGHVTCVSHTQCKPAPISSCLGGGCVEMCVTSPAHSSPVQFHLQLVGDGSGVRYV